MFETEIFGPCLVLKLKWGGGGGAQWPPAPAPPPSPSSIVAAPLYICLFCL